MVALGLPGLVSLGAESLQCVNAWTFERPGDLEGWQPNGHWADVRVADGVLHFRGAGPDPILEYQKPLDVPAEIWSVVEIRLKASQDGMGEIFWSNTSTGRYGGFSQEKSVRFPVRGDGERHTYRVRPGWQAERQIIRLRLDLYDAAAFELDAIRLLQPEGGGPPVAPEFDFSQGLAGWRGEDGAELRAGEATLTLRLPMGGAFAAAPSVDFDAAERTYVNLRMSVDRGNRGALWFAVADRAQLQRFTFPLKADGREHDYTLDLLGAQAWRGRIVALGLQASDDPTATARLRSLRVTAGPEGRATLAVTWFDTLDTLARTGRSNLLSAVVENRGGATAARVRSELRLPRGLRVVSGPQPAESNLAAGETCTIEWWVEALRPLEAAATLVLYAEDNPAVRVQTALRFSRSPRGLEPGRVPEPRPVRGALDVGVYYFPGWRTAGSWQPIRPFPERRPALGWYHEGHPEVADWHIKWAVEHGITFFIYDWYWSRGSRQLEHALHDGFFHARYRHLLKFCLLWANHNAPGTSSPEDCLDVTRFWITNYFRRPEHQLVEGKPLMIIFAPQRLSEDLGSDRVRPVLDTMRAECVRAGLKGLYLAACVGDAAQARQAAAEGYDAVTAYTWPHLGVPTGEWRAPFATLLEGYRRQWAHVADTAGVPLLLPVSGGWDSRPWHGENNFIRHDRTPALFGQHVREARAFVENRPAGAGVRPFLIVEAWNEWGEGAYIEPHREYGFGYLDALREALTEGRAPHEDVVPADVQLGPYEVAWLDHGRTAWDFERDHEGWSALMNLGLDEAGDGRLSLRTTAADPALVSPPLDIRASEFRSVGFRARCTVVERPATTERGQLYWTTSRLPETEASGVAFELAVDGAWHDYSVEVARNPRWRGRVTRLRLDPGERSGMRVEIDWIRLQR